MSLIVVLYIDVGFGGVDVIENILLPLGNMSKWQILPFHILFFVATTLLFGGIIWKVKEDAASIIFVMFSVVFISTLFISGHTPLQKWTKSYNEDHVGSSKQYTELVIILDGMIGADGVDRSIRGGEQLYTEIISFHSKHGFRHFPKAFSKYYLTMYSIPGILNSDYKDNSSQNTYIHEFATNRYEIIKNGFFDTILEKDKKLNVLQSEYVNYCNHPAVYNCNTIALHDPFEPRIDEGFEQGKIVRIFAIMQYTLMDTVFFKYLSNLIWSILPGLDRNADVTNTSGKYPVQFNSLTFSHWWDNFQESVEKSNIGSVFFAHFLFPHAPYNLDETCRAKSFWSPNGRRINEKRKMDVNGFQSIRNKHYIEYYKQARCAYKKLDKLVTSVDEYNRNRRLKIILLGDHGARISSGQTLPFLQEGDYVDNYSTLFSIRSDDIEPGLDDRMISVQQLFSAVNSDDFDMAVSEIEATVFVQKTRGDISVERIRVPMPKF